MGLHGSDTASIALDDVEVADDALMGEVGDGFKIAMSALDSGRYSVAAGCVGVCQGSLDHSVAYAKEREQFGRPIASFQLVQAMIADMRVQTDAARLLVYRAGWLKDAGRPSTTETSIAKLYATEAAQNCAHLAIQVHGGSGYVDDHPVERYFRDVRVTTLYEGTSQIQKLIIGRAETGINALAREPGGDREQDRADHRRRPRHRGGDRRRARAARLGAGAGRRRRGGARGERVRDGRARRPRRGGVRARGRRGRRAPRAPGRRLGERGDRHLRAARRHRARGLGADDRDQPAGRVPHRPRGAAGGHGERRLRRRDGVAGLVRPRAGDVGLRGVEGRRRGDVQQPADRGRPPRRRRRDDPPDVDRHRHGARGRRRAGVPPPARGAAAAVPQDLPRGARGARHRRRVRPPGTPHLHAAVRAAGARAARGDHDAAVRARRARRRSGHRAAVRGRERGPGLRSDG